jgi:copper transport protein
MNRFSAAILPVAVLLMIAGAVLAVVQVGSLPALWNTAYGNILLLKLAVVGGLLVLAGVNRLLFTPALTRNEARQTRGFARSIAAEGVLVLIILGLAAGWRFTPPPRAIMNRPSAFPPATASEPVSAHLHTGKAMALVTVDPGRTGRAAMTIRLVSPSGSSLTPKEVVVAVSSPSSGIEPFERHAVQAGPGIWRIEDLVFPVAGAWQLRIDVLVSDFDQIMLEGGIEIRA